MLNYKQSDIVDWEINVYEDEIVLKDEKDNELDRLNITSLVQNWIQECVPE